MFEIISEDDGVSEIERIEEAIRFASSFCKL